VFEIIYDNYTELATHKHGCCVIQKCIDYSTPQQTNELIKRALANTLILMCDQYGNYVLQYIISLKEYTVNHEIANIFKTNLPYLSKQKFSSNVIEKV
jgi:pumilio RNA-binding family